MKHTILAAAAAILAVAGATAPVHAQPAGGDSASKVPIARRLYEEGLEAVSKGRWSVAHDRFKASYDLAPRVLTLFNLAGAQGQTGRFIEASESYRKFLRETTDGRYADLRADATAQLEAIEKQVAQLTLEISGIERADVVAIDEIEFPQSALGEPIPMNPGPHTATITRDDAVLATRSITLAPGGAESLRIELPKKKVDLRLRGTGGTAAAEPGAADPSGGDRADDPPRRGRPLLKSPWFWTAAAVVLVGGAAGAYILTRPDPGTLVVH